MDVERVIELFLELGFAFVIGALGLVGLLFVYVLFDADRRADGRGEREDRLSGSPARHPRSDAESRHTSSSQAHAQPRASRESSARS